MQCKASPRLVYNNNGWPNALSRPVSRFLVRKKGVFFLQIRECVGTARRSFCHSAGGKEGKPRRRLALDNRHTPRFSLPIHCIKVVIFDDGIDHRTDHADDELGCLIALVRG